jgi:hypothetical protein
MEPMKRFVYVVAESANIVAAHEAAFECPSFWHTLVTAANEDGAYILGLDAYNAADDTLRSFRNDLRDRGVARKVSAGRDQ